MSVLPSNGATDLDEQSRQARLILQSMGESIIVTDLDGTITYWNEGATALFGYSAAEMLGRTPALLYPDSAQTALHADLAAILAGQDYVGQWRGWRKDGSVFWIDIRTTLLLGEDGVPIGFVGVARASTARRQTEARQQLLQSATETLLTSLDPEQALWQVDALLALAQDAIIVRAPDGTISRWNAGATALYGWTVVEATGQVTHTLLRTRVLADGSGARRGTDMTGEDIDTRLAAGGTWEGTLEHTRRDGARLVVESRQALVCDELGRPAAILEINRDSTAREAFVSSLAHDLKTPLTGILGHAQLAARYLDRLASPATEPIRSHLAQVGRAARSLARMIDELADVTRLRLGDAVELQRQPVDLVALVRAAVAQQEGLTGHHLAVEASVPTTEVLVDAPRLERTLGNLLANAIKYSPEGSGITVRIGLADDERGPGALVAVHDQGVGIPAEDLHRIFEPFYRARNVADTVPGTGLGLAGARAIVEQHGGTISAESAQGVGTTVQIWLPRT